MSDSRPQSTIWLLLRLGLCVAALAYVLSQTRLHDTIWLQDRPEPVRLLEMRPDGAEVRIDGRHEVVPPAQWQRDPDGQPRIDRGLLSLAAISDKRLLLLAIAIYGLHPLLQIVRFRWMLFVQRYATSWPLTVAVCLIGNFYSYVIPGTTGGDVVRAAYLMRGSPNPHGALVAIGLDRLTGLAGLLGLAAFVGMFAPAEAEKVRVAAAVSGGILLAMVVGFAAVTGRGFVGRWLGRLPLGAHLKLLYEAVSASRRGWGWLIAAVLLTMALQTAAMSAFSVAAVALGMDPAWRQYFVCLPIALTVASIPIVPMGVGTLEATMVFLLAGRVGSVSQVLGLAVAMRIIGLIWALPGGLVPLFWRRAAARPSG